MRFESIAITGGQADTVDPRTTPGAVPAALMKETPQALTGSDTPPTVAVLTLEGTATQTVDVEMYALDESAQVDAARFADNPVAGDASRQFYLIRAAVTVTVGVCSYVRTVPGKVYYRLVNAPAADARLKIGFSSGVPT
jgi:hypothetical protein